MANQEITDREEGGKIEKLPQGEYTIDGTMVKVGILGQVVEFDMRHIAYCDIIHECEPESSYIRLTFPDATGSTRVIKFRIDDNEKLSDLAQNIHCYYIANQEITDREKDGKQEKLPQEGYGQKPMSRREKERDIENNIAVSKITAFFYPKFLDFAEYKCGDYNLNMDSETILKEALIEAESHNTFNRLKAMVDEYRNLVVSILDRKVKTKAMFDQVAKDMTDFYAEFMPTITNVDVLKFLAEKNYLRKEANHE